MSQFKTINNDVLTSKIELTEINDRSISRVISWADLNPSDLIGSHVLEDYNNLSNNDTEYVVTPGYMSYPVLVISIVDHKSKSKFMIIPSKEIVFIDSKGKQYLSQFFIGDICNFKLAI